MGLCFWFCLSCAPSFSASLLFFLSFVGLGREKAGRGRREREGTKKYYSELLLSLSLNNYATVAETATGLNE